MGTTTIVIGERGVVVFDGGGMPLQAKRVLEQIASVTDRPVTHIVISHWHGDHHLGLAPIVDAHPDAAIISHEFTRAAMLSALMGDVHAARENPGALRESFDNALANTDAAPEFRAWVRQAYDHVDMLTEQQMSRDLFPATLTFTDRLTLDLGDRTVELHHLGPANTGGDIVMWLPRERVLATGDMVVRPTPFGFFSHPRSWADALRSLQTFDAAVVVPGHGDLMYDWSYVDLLIETMELVQDQVDAMVAEGHDLEGIRSQIDFSAVENRITGGDPWRANRFDAWFKRPIVEAAYTIATGGETESLGAIGR
jgi:cyclase